MFQAGWLGCEHGGPGSTAVGHRMWVGPGVHGAATVKWPQLLGLYCGISVFLLPSRDGAESEQWGMRSGQKRPGWDQAGCSGGQIPEPELECSERARLFCEAQYSLSQETHKKVELRRGV